MSILPISRISELLEICEIFGLLLKVPVQTGIINK